MAEEARWRVTISGGKTSEPLDEEAIRRLVEEGEVRRSSMVMDEATGSWVPIKMVPRLWALFPDQGPADAPETEDEARPAAGRARAATPRRERPGGLALLALASIAFGALAFLPFVRSFLWIPGILAAASVMVSSRRGGSAGAAAALATAGLLLSLAAGALFVGRTAMHFMGFRTASNQPSCLAQLHELAEAFSLYAQDNGGRFPSSAEGKTAATSAAALALLIPAYITDPAIIYCPQCRVGEGTEVTGRTYAYAAGLTADSPGFLPLAWDDLWAEDRFRVHPFDAHGVGGCNLLRVDGSAEWVESTSVGETYRDLPSLREDATAAARSGGRVIWGHAAPGEVGR